MNVQIVGVTHIMHLTTQTNRRLLGHMTLNREQIQVILRGLNARIEELRAEIEEIEKTKRALAKMNSSQAELGELGDSTAQRRLPKGSPRKLIERALADGGSYTVGQIRTRIRNSSNTSLVDTTARRILKELIAENKVLRAETGEYRLVVTAAELKKEDSIKDDADDGLPF